MVIDWDTYFMGVAKLSSLRSKDRDTQVGACIVNKDKRIIAIGYNGFPRNCEDDCFPWEKEGDFVDTKYAYVVHAEANAILNSTKDLKGATLYVSLFPCNECTKLIIQSGIEEVVYQSNKYEGRKENIAALKMFNAAKVKLRKMKEFNVEIKE